MSHCIITIQDASQWPLVDPLPSYGRGRERPGGRYMSLLHGDGLHDVIITGKYHLSYSFTFSSIPFWVQLVASKNILTNL